jgi:hypothetical protein
MTSEIDIGLNEDFHVIPGIGEFGDQYFGKDDDNKQVEGRSWWLFLGKIHYFFG